MGKHYRQYRDKLMALMPYLHTYEEWKRCVEGLRAADIEEIKETEFLQGHPDRIIMWFGYPEKNAPQFDGLAKVLEKYEAEDA